MINRKLIGNVKWNVSGYRGEGEALGGDMVLDALD